MNFENKWDRQRRVTEKLRRQKEKWERGYSMCLQSTAITIVWFLRDGNTKEDKLHKTKGRNSPNNLHIRGLLLLRLQQEQGWKYEVWNVVAITLGIA